MAYKIYKYTHLECIFTLQGVQKNWKCNEIVYKLRYMTIINIALPKKSLWSGAFEVLISKLYKYTYLKCIFTIRVSKKRNRLKIWIYDVYQYTCSDEKFYLYNVLLYESLLAMTYRYAHLECIFITHCVPKKGKNLVIWAMKWDILHSSIILQYRKVLPLWGGAFWMPFVHKI